MTSGRTSDPFAARPPSPKAAAGITLKAEQAARLDTPISPETAAVRFGFESLEAVEAGVPERVRGFVPDVLTSRAFRSEVDGARVGHGEPAPPSVILARLIDRCTQADRTAVAAAESQARWATLHRCAVTGEADASTRRRRAPWGGQTLMLSDLGASALDAAWLESLPADVKANARALLPEQPEPTTRRKRAS